MRSVTCTASDPWPEPKDRTPGVMRLSSVTGLRVPMFGPRHDGRELEVVGARRGRRAVRVARGVGDPVGARGDRVLVAVDVRGVESRRRTARPAAARAPAPAADCARLPAMACASCSPPSRELRSIASSTPRPTTTMMSALDHRLDEEGAVLRAGEPRQGRAERMRSCGPTRGHRAAHRRATEPALIASAIARRMATAHNDEKGGPEGPPSSSCDSVLQDYGDLPAGARAAAAVGAAGADVAARRCRA